MSKIQIHPKAIFPTLIVIGVLIMTFLPDNSPAVQSGEINSQPQHEVLQAEAADYKQEAEKLKAEAELKAKKAEALNQVAEAEKGLAELTTKSEEAKKDEAVQVQPVSVPPAPEPVKEAPKPVATATRQRQFKLNSGKMQSGEEIINYVYGNPVGKQFYDSFNTRFGQEVADKAAIVLFYENGTLKPDSVGVCNRKHMINGDYRNCAYADMNSAGMDAGLKQINTHYQRFRIAKLGGPNCTAKASRDRKDPCTAQQVAWLQNVDNNIKIAMDIYAESGFGPWVGARRAGIK